MPKGLALYLLCLIVSSVLLIGAAEINRAKAAEATALVATYEDAECQYEGLTCEQGQALLESQSE